MTTEAVKVGVALRKPLATQAGFVSSQAARIIVRGGRRGGKTVGAATKAVEEFVSNEKRVLYAAPTSEQTDRFWFEVQRALRPGVDAGLWHMNETERFVERSQTENRIKAKTAWNANTLRGDYADLLILDEWQLMSEDTWYEVGAPMLLDNNGRAIFIYTPPSLSSTGVSRAIDPLHASKMFREAAQDQSGRWLAASFTSLDNPTLSRTALGEMTNDMSPDAYRREILADDDELERGLLVYAPFNTASQKVPRFPIPDEWPRYVGHDFGAANPAALFLAHDPATGFFYAYHEYRPPPGRSVAQHVEEFKRIAQQGDVPITGTVLKRVGGSHQEDEIRQAYLAHGWPIQEPKLRLVNAQVDKVRGIMELNKLFVFSDLYNYLGELATCTFEVGADGQPTDKIKGESRFHLSAAARYILSDFAPETVARQRREPVTLRSW